MVNNWSELDLQKDKENRANVWGGPMQSDPGPESRLQSKIEAYAKREGYPCLSIRQLVTKYRRISYLFKDWPDISIALPAARTVWLELKGHKGVLKAGQRELAMQLIALGHEWHQVRSYKRFLEIIEEPNQ